MFEPVFSPFLLNPPPHPLGGGSKPALGTGIPSSQNTVPTPASALAEPWICQRSTLTSLADPRTANALICAPPTPPNGSGIGSFRKGRRSESTSCLRAAKPSASQLLLLLLNFINFYYYKTFTFTIRKLLLLENIYFYY